MNAEHPAFVDALARQESIRADTDPGDMRQTADQTHPCYDTPNGRPCPRSVRPDGSVSGDGACHECGLGPACPLRDPWADGILD